MIKLCSRVLPRSRTFFELRKTGVMPFHSTVLKLSENDKIDSFVKVAEIPKKGKAKRLINTVNRSKDTDGNSSWRDNTALPEWKRQKFALKEKLNGERWNPKKKLSREQMETVRLLKRQFPNMTSGDIAIQMKVSPEVVRRILKSKWEPTEEELEDIQRRWKKRSDKILDLYENGQIGGYTGIIPVTRKVIIGGPNSEHIIHRKKPQQDLRPSNKPYLNKSKPVDKGALRARNNLHLLLKKKI